MINPEVAIPLAVALATPVALVYRWFQHRERLAQITAHRDRAPDDAARLARLEHAVDAIAVEMERVGEGQRFLARLLAESGTPRRDTAPGLDGGTRPRARVNTPH